MKRFKLFLASSAELSQERKGIAVMINRLNNKWTEEKDVYIELVIWENLPHSFRDENIQSYFNREMLTCDMVLALFYKKVGQFTEEEFKLAYENLKNGNNPHYLLVYFKSGSVPIEEIDEELLKIGKLKREIQEYKQIYGTFISMDDLLLKLQHQLELTILQEQETSLEKSESERKEKARLDFENYKKHLWQKFRYLDFTGLNAILQKPLELEKVYVKLRARESLPVERFRTIAEFRRLVEAEANKPKKKYKDFVTLFKQLYKRKQEESEALRMLILGHPGSGKTTLMKWVALQCLKSEHKEFFSQFTPIFISLKYLGSDPDNTFRKKSIGNLIVYFFEKENISVDLFIGNQMKANRLLFLLDGLDEIGDEKIRREVIDWIQKQYIYQNSVIVTSRFSGLDKAKGLKFREEIPVFEIQNFEMNDVEDFLHNWYRNVEIAVGGEVNLPNAIEEGDRRFKELMVIIKNDRYKNIRELAVNPLLLNIIAIVHRTRAILPRDRHKLYEECLKVMIELWNLANRKIDISFSSDNSMSLLSKIALRLMESGRREMDKKEIEECLPLTIEGRTQEFFLKEMVLKAGILYESEGKIGFLHLTFQEYLAARYFANYKKQNQILNYCDEDYWEETFKLFINIGNAQLFFDEVIEYLLEKKYWAYMRFWETCLEEIVIEETKEAIELIFSGKVIEILSGLEYKKKNDELIETLCLHYPLYKHGKKLVIQGWDLFYNAPHPFVQSVGASILNRADENTKTELINRMKHRIDDFEKHTKEKKETLLYFYFQNNNNFILQVSGRSKLTDFNYGLLKLKSTKMFLQYMLMRDIRNIIFIRYILDIRDILNILDIQDMGYILDIQLIRDIMDIQDIQDMLDIQHIRDIRVFSEEYDKKYKTIFKKNQGEISKWAELAIEKLHSMSDRQLLEYFPNTTPKELREFRENREDKNKGQCVKNSKR
jgi:energy-coupling factor transporter ATP-binding protein EcfA2